MPISVQRSRSYETIALAIDSLKTDLPSGKDITRETVLEMLNDLRATLVGDTAVTDAPAPEEPSREWLLGIYDNFDQPVAATDSAAIAAKIVLSLRGKAKVQDAEGNVLWDNEADSDLSYGGRPGATEVIATIERRMREFNAAAD